MPLRAPDDTIEFHDSSMRDGELLNEHLFDRIARFQILSELPDMNGRCAEMMLSVLICESATAVATDPRSAEQSSSLDLVVDFAGCAVGDRGLESIPAVFVELNDQSRVPLIEASRISIGCAAGSFWPRSRKIF